MKCEQAREYFAGFEDNTLSPDLRLAVEKHLESCPDCAALMNDLQDYHKIIKCFKEPCVECGASFQMEIINHVKELRNVENWWDRFWNSKSAMRLAYSTAALSAIFVILFVFSGYFDIKSDDTPMAANSELASSGALQATVSPHIASPVEASSNNPVSYNFNIEDKELTTVYQSQSMGERVQRSLTFRQVQEAFAEIMYLMGIKELESNPEIARTYLDYVHTNLKGTRYSEDAKRQLAQITVSSP